MENEIWFSTAGESMDPTSMILILEYKEVRINIFRELFFSVVFGGSVYYLIFVKLDTILVSRTKAPLLGK
jgi:hypothetical protein